MHQVDVAVIGGGAAGLMTALTAGGRARRVAVLEGQERLGKKILISGGGRCNFTNLGARAENYLSAQPDFCKSALARFTPYHFVEMVERHGIPYHEKKLGQQFCDGSSKEIVALLEAECAEAGVSIFLNRRVSAVEPQPGGGFQVEAGGEAWRAESVVIATGGLSFPKLGATDFAYVLSRRLGLKVVDPRPGLVPFTWKEGGFAASLSGLSLPVVARCGGTAFEESLLFTHFGLSGPAVLQISSYWKQGETVSFDLLPGLDAVAWLRENRGGAPLSGILAEKLPRRLAQQWAAAQHPGAKPRWAQEPAAVVREIAGRLNAWPVRPEGTEGYAKAEVTLGGVATEGLSSKTMESRAVPGLFFVGEAVDVTGWLGGYNFQWAWASGRAAGLAA
ncbi:MAG: NAD(P)/FAD-dependent oxidoreductase [Verrucomicrobium sp.]|nr:NAD(P)/FAD-dependent oxidoreductase [Verrucomicrobium sp.]